jgi:hypothetical protein
MSSAEKKNRAEAEALQSGTRKKPESPNGKRIPSRGKAQPQSEAGRKLSEERFSAHRPVNFRYDCAE